MRVESGKNRDEWCSGVWGLALGNMESILPSFDLLLILFETMFYSIALPIVGSI